MNSSAVSSDTQLNVTDVSGAISGSPSSASDVTLDLDDGDRDGSRNVDSV
jgi:hypothetical protein